MSRDRSSKSQPPRAFASPVRLLACGCMLRGVRTPIHRASGCAAGSGSWKRSLRSADVAIVAMGFCFGLEARRRPAARRNAPMARADVALLPNLRLILLVGQYSKSGIWREDCRQKPERKRSGVARFVSATDHPRLMPGPIMLANNAWSRNPVEVNCCLSGLTWLGSSGPRLCDAQAWRWEGDCSQPSRGSREDPGRSGRMGRRASQAMPGHSHGGSRDRHDGKFLCFMLRKPKPCVIHSYSPERHPPARRVLTAEEEG
jgi:hypothetical protein